MFIVCQHFMYNISKCFLFPHFSHFIQKNCTILSYEKCIELFRYKLYFHQIPSKIYLCICILVIIHSL